MERLSVSFGYAARDTLCAEFDLAKTSILAEFHDLADKDVIASINAAAQRQDVTVEVHVEARPSRYSHAPGAAQHDARALAALRGKLDDRVSLIAEDDPGVLMHCKAAVVDNDTALIGTANPTKSGFESDGEILVTSHSPGDVAAVAASVAGQAVSGDYVVAGPDASLRLRLRHLLNTDGDLRIATEDLSDREVVSALLARSAAGHHDRLLVEDKDASSAQRIAERQLLSSGVDVRGLASGYMHEKYVDAGDEIYVGSANLTRNGIDEAREIGVVAPTAAFGPGASAMRTGFDAMWTSARAVACG